MDDDYENYDYYEQEDDSENWPDEDKDTGYFPQYDDDYFLPPQEGWADDNEGGYWDEDRPY